MVYTFHLRKGGDGKTTLTGNVARGLALAGKKTCVIDCDSQANLTKWFAADEGTFELADIFEGECSPEEALIPVSENLFLIGTANEESSLPEWEKAKLQDKIFVFRKLVRDLRDLGFEFIFFDLPPTFTTLHQRAYLAVDEVIAATTPTEFSEDGMFALAQDVEEVNENFEVNVRYRRVILGKVNLSMDEHQERVTAIEELKTAGYEIFIVPQSTAVSEAQRTRKYGPGKTVYDPIIKKKNRIKVKDAYQLIVDSIITQDDKVAV